MNLRHIRAGGRVFTTSDWLNVFFEAVAAADVEYFAAQHDASIPVQRVRKRSEAERERAIANAEAQLRGMGA